MIIFSPVRENKYDYPDELQEMVLIAGKLFVGRQYFATGLEMIWKYIFRKFK